MLFSIRMPLKPLAAFCRRMATSLLAGIDLRTVWARESQNVPGAGRRKCLAAIGKAINQGESLGDALAPSGDLFPALVVELIGVGEQSGLLGEVFAQLAEHYEGQLRLRRAFLAGIAWPMTELSLALLVIGLLIWVMGVIGQSTGSTFDMLGFGLVGNSGLAIYLATLATAGVLLYCAVRAAARGALWVRPIQRAVLYVPVLGPALQTLALARLAWSMSLVMNTHMEVRRGLRLSLQSTGNARYTDQIERVEREIARGNSIYEAFCAAGCFPPDFLDSVQVAEQSGTVVESMVRLARLYQEQARTALGTLSTLAGFAVWILVAAFIVVLIFRIFSFYIGTIRAAMP
jgi:type IV pilus assembly protein PilC